jgi:hypothetical protein
VPIRSKRQRHRRRILDALLDPGQEAVGLAAVDDAVIV